METVDAGKTAERVRLTRRKLLIGSAALGGVATFPMPAVLAQTKEFQGTTINGASFQHGFQLALKEMLPEFTSKTGINVNLDLQGFAVYNQRMDLELSTQGSAYDFCNITFPFSGRWVGSGWLSALNEFTSNANTMPPDWDPSDFIAGAQAPFALDGKIYGFAWVTGVQMLAASRADLIEKAGLKMPTTLDELMNVCAATHNSQTAAFGNDKLHNWQWPPYLMGFGGRVFTDASGKYVPALDTPEAVKAAQFYATLLSKYGPSGVLSYTDDQVQRAQFAGRVNIRTQSLDWLLPIGKSADSRSRDTVRYAPMPAGPAGAFPGVNSQGFGIPSGSKQKRAAWEFIKWAVSKETVLKLALEKNQISVTRKSALQDPRLKEAMTVNGQDLSIMFMDAAEAAGKQGYMKYRTSPVFPQVGEKINKAIERIASGQATPEEAMAAANKEANDDLRKTGNL